MKSRALLLLLKRKLPGEKILIANMEGNRWASVVRTKSGRFVNRAATDIVVPA